MTNPFSVHAIPQVMIGVPTGRALPQMFFGSHVCEVILKVFYFQQEPIDLCAIVVHRA
jgi:hypothetical protein